LIREEYGLTINDGVENMSVQLMRGYSVHLCGDEAINQECKDLDVVVNETLLDDPIQVALRDNPEYGSARLNVDETETPITWIVEIEVNNGVNE
jgi:hypothetical protein